MQDTRSLLPSLPRKHRPACPGIALGALISLCLAAGAASAQQPTAEQKSAIQSACRSDFMTQCSGVTPGGKAALSCLQQHSSSLSATCRQAVGAISGTGGAAATQPPAAAAPATTAQPAPTFTPRQEMVIAREACGGDFRAYCRAVPLGGGRGITCLRQNMQRLSPSCRKVLSSGL
jgi:hypothetical protein